MNVPTIDRLLKELNCSFWTQTGLNRVLTLATFIHQALFTRPVGIWMRRRRRRILCPRLHLLSQTEGPHICPHFLDVGKAVGLQPYFPDRIPTEWVLFVLRPDRILLLMI